MRFCICTPLNFFLAAALPLFVGCHRQPRTADGSMGKPGQADSVDNSWANAAKACWPQLAKNGSNDVDLRKYLIDPAHFRSTFPAYEALSDANVRAELSMPLTTIFPPDPTRLANSATPVLTRGQAVNGVSPGGAVTQSTHGNAPPDALCSIQTGTPEGFNQ